MVWIFRARERAQMSTSEPEAEVEYSRGSRASRGVSGRPAAASGGVRIALAIAVLGALALVAAEFLALLHVRSSQRGTGVIASVLTGSHDSFALIPIALIALVFVAAAIRAPARAPLAALLALGLIALAIALLGDLPDARATGLLRLAGGSYASAQASPAAGFYLETLGAVALIAGGGAGLLAAGTGRSGGRSVS
jgi:hypothetical protein